jgi:hypothetical protein
MERYKNLSGDSGVTAYKIDNDSITVRFIDGTSYLYTKATAGAQNISEMQRLARDGQGLSTFISRVVKDRYAKKS